MSKIKICHLYPDILNLAGERGNLIALQNRLIWRGLEFETETATIGKKLDFNEFDLFFIGGGEDFDKSVLLEELNRGSGQEIKAAIEDEKVFIAICGGYQILGNSYEDISGNKLDCLGALDITTVEQKDRMVGDCLFNYEELDYNIVGFENHSGATFLGQGVKQLGKVISGKGNNGKDSTEGVRFKNVFASYFHGPILPRNPKFCDHILETVLERKNEKVSLIELDDKLENAAHDYMENRLKK